MGCDRNYVLVVDDQHDAADSMAILLSLWGYDGEAQYSGATALVAASIRSPEAVLLDLEMPGMDGFEFVAHFRGLHGCEQTPIVAVSGHTTAACLACARKLGIDHYLFKPAHLGQLRALLGGLIVARELPHECAEPWLRTKERTVRLAAVY